MYNMTLNTHFQLDEVRGKAHSEANLGNLRGSKATRNEFITPADVRRIQVSDACVTAKICCSNLVPNSRKRSKLKRSDYTTRTANQHLTGSLSFVHVENF